MSVHTTPAPEASFMVQIAAVARPEDADVLVHALRRLKYTVTAEHEGADNLFHVRMGPFATRREADEWRTLLANDGYNAVVQQ
jgi:cell division septation protein DedD